MSEQGNDQTAQMVTPPPAADPIMSSVSASAPAAKSEPKTRRNSFRLPKLPDRPIRTRKATMEEILRILRGENGEAGVRGVKTMRLEIDFDD